MITTYYVIAICESFRKFGWHAFLPSSNFPHQISVARIISTSLDFLCRRDHAWVQRCLPMINHVSCFWWKKTLWVLGHAVVIFVMFIMAYISWHVCLFYHWKLFVYIINTKWNQTHNTPMPRAIAMCIQPKVKLAGWRTSQSHVVHAFLCGKSCFNQTLHSLKLIAHPWKLMSGDDPFLVGLGPCSWAMLVLFREGGPSNLRRHDLNKEHPWHALWQL